MTFRLRASLECRSLAIGLVSTLIDHVSAADRGFRNEMVTAFGEAFNNIVMHGYRDQADGMLDVEAELSAEEMTIRLIDNGLVVDFERVPAPDLDSMPEGGMGVFLIHAMVDEVAYQGGTPNVLALTKRITASATNTPRGPEPR